MLLADFEERPTEREKAGTNPPDKGPNKVEKRVKLKGAQTVRETTSPGAFSTLAAPARVANGASGALFRPRSGTASDS